MCECKKNDKYQVCENHADDVNDADDNNEDDDHADDDDDVDDADDDDAGECVALLTGVGWERRSSLN